MLKLLIKKQLLEIFRSYYYDEKKNKARSKASTMLFILWFVLLMVGLLGGMFTFLSIKLCKPMLSVNISWLYFALLGLLAIFMGTFGSVFNTYASLYLAKDNDLLLSMPISVSVLVASRLFVVYLMGLMYSGVVLIPAIIVYWITAGIRIPGIVGGILMICLISIFVMTLSCALGWVVAKISLKLKNKSIITVLVSLILISGYYFFYFKAQSMIKDLLSHLTLYGENIKKSAYPLYLFGRVGVGDRKAIVIVSFVVIALFALMWMLISKSFLNVATSTGTIIQTKNQETVWKKKNISRALLDRELYHFTSSSNYMLNCGLGLFFTPVLAIAVIWKGRAIFSMLSKMFAETQGGVLILLAVLLCGIASMNIMTAPSISLEGRSLWLIQSLPIIPWQVLRAKIKMQLILTEIPMIVCLACISFVCQLKMTEILILTLQVMSYVFLIAVFGMFLGIKKPIFTWTNEIVPIKQSASVMITMFGGIGYTILLFIGYIVLQGWMLGYVAYISIFILGNVVISMILYRWIKTKGNF